MNLSRAQIFKLGITTVLLIVAVGFGLTLRNLNHSLSPAQPDEENLSETHSSEGQSVLQLKGREQLDELFGQTITGSIISQLYGDHYNEYKQLERTAEVVSVDKQGETAGSFVVRFTPSGDLLHAKVTVHNQATKDFDISITKGNK